ncbi:MAG: acetate uptake transporter [Sulfobacillus sp.]
MTGKLGNPGPLGLAGFAFTTWMLSMINAGWYSASALGMVIALAMAYGGTAQMVAGVLEFRRGNTFGTVAFFSYGAFWWSFALFAHYFGSTVPASFIGWYLFVWGIFTFYMWVATLKTTMALQLVFLALWITFVLLAIGAWGLPSMTIVGGYMGLITAILAFYLSAAEVINEYHERTVLPVGPFKKTPATTSSQSA